MKAAFYLYSALLILEGLLAWHLSGEAFLLMALICGLMVYVSVQHAARPVTEGVRLMVSIALAVAGPLQYQLSLAPLLLCFIALPHFLAATQAFAESAGHIPRREGPGMRTMVFTIAFYTSMGLVLLLARGMEPEVSRPASTLLAVGVLLAALPAWDLSRIPRLPAASPDQPGSAPRRLILPAVLLGLTALIFNGPLPFAAQFLSRLSPHWRMDPVEFKNKPPKPPPTTPAAKPVDGPATRSGTDESSITGEHRLPPSSDLKSSDIPRFYIQTDPPALAAALLEKGPVYVRSHTLNRFSDNKWSAEVTGGVWITDEADGSLDGMITFQPSPPVPAVPHEVFAMDADGYTVPAIAGLTAIQLPRVYAVPGDVLQSPATGDIRYRAVSAPVLYQSLPNPSLLATGPTDKVHLTTPDGETGLQMKRLADSIFGREKLLSDRIEALRDFFAKHYSYSTVMKNPRNMGALENFLFDERRGHCDFYASAATLLLREGGIPARVAYGFATQEADPASHLLIVRDRQAHAWTEIYLKNYGWTICDFTPAENIGQPDGKSTPPLSPPQPDLKNFADAAKDAKLPAPAKIEESFSLFAKLLTWWKQQTWTAPVLRFAPHALLGIGVLVLVLHLLRRKPPDEAAAAAQARAAMEKQPPYYLEFLRLCAAAGHPKPEGLTPLEHFRALEQAGQPVPPLRPLISYHCATRYEDIPRDPGQEKSFTGMLEDFARTLQSAPLSFPRLDIG